MKIGIFGGTFNPVHVEHINMALGAIESLGLDKLYIVPANVPPHKIGQAILDYNIRYEMLKIAFQNIDKVEISAFEKEFEKANYTYLTIEHYKMLFPEAEIYFMIGTDMLLDFASWKNPKDILKNSTLFVTPRMGDNQEFALNYYLARFDKKPIISNYIGKNISSTKIKTLYKLGFSVNEYLPKKVLEYIENNGIFAADEFYCYIRNTLPEKRLLHTAGVVIKAIALAKLLKVNVEKCELAALLHDVAKYMNPNEFENFTMPDNVPKNVVHQYLGAYVAENVLKVKDLEVLDAIRFHSTGKPNMSMLGKIVFVADLIEENRNYNGVEELRKAVSEDFNKGFLLSLERTIKFLNIGGETIFPLTLECYEYYKNNL